MDYRIKEPDVIYELFDGEVVLINLETGNYFSVQGTAAEIWQDIVNGMAIEDMIERLLSRYQGDVAHITESVSAFLKQLSEDSLIEFVDAAEKEVEQRVEINLDAQAAKDLPVFELPKLDRYTDMQDLLLLDPIHDVGEAGWPHQKPDDLSNSQ